MVKILDRVWQQTGTTGTGTLTLGGALPGFLTAAEAGGVDTDEVEFVIRDGDDFELSRGVLGSSGATLTRATVIRSKIGGTVGTSKINLSGAAEVFVVASAAWAALLLSQSDIATFAQFNSATAGKVVANDSVWASLVSLTDGATIALDFDTGYDFAVILGGNRTLGAPTNARSGKKGIVWASATGSTRTLTLDAAWNLATGVEAGPYSITTSQELGVAYVIRGTTVVVTAIIRRG